MIAALTSDFSRYIVDFFSISEPNSKVRSQRSQWSLCFSSRWKNRNGSPNLLLADTFVTCSLQPLNGIQRNWTGSNIFTSYTNFVFFVQTDWKTKMSVQSSNWLRHYQLLFCNHWMEFNEKYSTFPPNLCFSGPSLSACVLFWTKWYTQVHDFGPFVV